MEEQMDIISCIEKARNKYLKANPNFQPKNLKGRNHVQRTRFVSIMRDNLASRFAGNNLSDLRHNGYQGTYRIWPSDFVDMLADEMGVSVALLVNDIDMR